MKVYLDVIWALNMLFDCLLLSLAALILKRSVSPWRIAAGGLIGSLIILLQFAPYGYYFLHPLSKLLFSVAMVLAAFGYKRLKFFISALMALYFSTFLVGGALTGAHYYFQSADGAAGAFLSNASAGFGDPVSWLFVLIGFPLAWHFSKNRIENLEMAKIRYDQIVNVHIVINNESFHFTGLVDSGNQLYDPLSGLPVMFASVKKTFEEMPEAIRIISSGPEAVIHGEKPIPAEWESRLRIIPCSVVGQEHQLVLAVKPDIVSIRKGSETYRTKKALVSFTLQQLSAEGSFDCIVHPKLLAGIPESGPVMAS